MKRKIVSLRGALAFVGAAAMIATVGLGAQKALAAAPDFVISDTVDGGDCTVAPFNGTWDGGTSTCTVTNFVALDLQSLTVDPEVTVTVQGGSGGGSAQWQVRDGSLTNNGVMTFLGAAGQFSGSLTNNDTAGTITNNGLMTFVGGDGLGSAVFGNDGGQATNNCGATITMIGGDGDFSARLSGQTVSPIINRGTIDLIPGTGANSGTSNGLIVEGPPCNTAPVADAGPDQPVILLGNEVQLDGSESYDLEGDELTYAWTLSAECSSAALDDSTSDKPSFTPDAQCDYTATLTVSETSGPLSDTDTVIVTFNNVKPVADAGYDQSVRVGDEVLLDGTGSYDANNDPLTYQWSCSNASIVPDNVAMTSFVPDVAGEYVVNLVVNDGSEESDPGTATIVATTAEGELADEIEKTIDEIKGTPPEHFTKMKLQKVMTNKTAHTAKLIDEKKHAAAKQEIEMLTVKTNGCDDSSADPKADPNDWIKNCESQRRVRERLEEDKRLLEEIMKK